MEGIGAAPRNGTTLAFRQNFEFGKENPVFCEPADLLIEEQTTLGRTSLHTLVEQEEERELALALVRASSVSPEVTSVPNHVA